jgi:hypothetical protein
MTACVPAAKPQRISLVVRAAEAPAAPKKEVGPKRGSLVRWGQGATDWVLCFSTAIDDRHYQNHLSHCN